jgi:hypothetical protein
VGLGSLRVEQPALRPAGFPARLRSLFGSPGWSKRPEPRIRYGQPFLPGLAVVGRQHLLEARAFLECADAVRGRRFTHRGRTVGFPGRIDWDPRGLPEAWRVALNGGDELVALGVAGALAPNAEVRRGWYETAIDLVRDWVAGAPEGRGVAWEVPALSHRIPNVLYAHVMFAAELRTEPDARRLVLESLYAQAAALATAITGWPTDRWLVHAGRALFMAGRFFDGMEARGWLERGATMLWSQLREQVNEDGGHVERTPAVHALVLADYLEVLAVLAAAHDDVPIWARKRVKGMADFLARLLHPDGELPLFHDTGLGMAPPAHELLATAAVVLHEPGLAPPGDLPGIWPLLLVGEPGRRAHAHLSRRRPEAEPRALRRTGFYVLPGAPGDVMLLDGAGAPAGGDAGVFGYELSVGGARLLVDSGVVGDEPAPWAGYFHGTRAHNVVSVAGADQFAVGRPTAVSEVQWVVRDGMVYFGGVHDGFARLAPDLRLRHRRHVFCLPGRFWVVCDEVTGSGEWEVESFLHFHPEVSLVARCGERTSFTASRSETAWLQVVPAGARELRVVSGEEVPRPLGWYAPRVGERGPSPTLSLVCDGPAPLVCGYALLPRTAGPARLDLDYDAFRLHARLVTGEHEYLLSVVQGDVELVTRTPAR